MDTNLEKKIDNHRNHRIAAGIILIVFGAATLLQHSILLSKIVDIGNYIVLMLGLGMLVWGSVSRRTGWIIPGGVLTGIGLGILAQEGHWFFPAAGQDGVFLLCFAFGWFLITLLTGIFTCTQWWALIPGGIMAVIGGSILITNGAIRWQDLNLVYAILLLCIGLFLIVYKGRAKKNQ
jgi:hypothetical protein